MIYILEMSFIAKLSHINKVIYYTFIIVSFSLLYPLNIGNIMFILLCIICIQIEIYLFIHLFIYSSMYIIQKNKRERESKFKKLLFQ